MMNILKFVFLMTALMLSCELHSQIMFSFEPSPNVSTSLKSVMDGNISALLTEINRAGMVGDNLDLSGINMEDGARERLNSLWQDSRIICNSTINRSKCLEDYQGFQARDISVTMKSSDGSEPVSRELTVSLNKAGERFEEGMKGTMADYEIVSINETPIMDVYKMKVVE